MDFGFEVMKIEEEHSKLKDKKDKKDKRDIKQLLPEVKLCSFTHSVWIQGIDASNIEQYYNNTSRAVGLLGGLKDKTLDSFAEKAKIGIFPEKDSGPQEKGWLAYSC